MSDSSDRAEMGRPGPEHERLAPFVGTFRARVRLWTRPDEPLQSTGTMVNTWDLGGLFVRQEYTGDPGEGPFPAFEGRGFWGYNKVTRRYEGVWLDNASTLIQAESGTVDETGKVWTMSCELPNPQTGAPMTKRSILTLDSDERHTMVVHFDTGGGSFKAIEIDYTRVR